ncbi:MAG: LOG family protein [Thermoleophilia bacterium]|nr:LOG family protein [Thermoleophilia bacterium]
MAPTIEIETAAELTLRVESGLGLTGAVVQGVDLGEAPVDWDSVELAGAFFVGCRIPDGDVALTLQRHGAIVVPALGDGRPFRVHPPHLYSYEDLVGSGLDAAVRSYFETTRRRRGDPDPELPVEAIAQRLHDTAMSDAIWDLVRPEGERPRRVAGIMGGHRVRRDDPGYRLATELGYELAASGLTIATGGGPGIMEAGNLGAYLTRAGDRGAIDAALATLARAPSVEHPDYGIRADEVHARHAGGAGGVSLAIPTWLYGHEPVGRFATHIAKYFANSIREDGLLRVAAAGIVFAPGGAGTVQEIFQDVAVNAYAPAGERAPIVFLGAEWFRSSGIVAVVERFAGAADPPFADLVLVTDSVAAAVERIVSHPIPGRG